MTNDERRAFKRIPFDADTQIRQGEGAWSVVLIDLSLNGLLIEEPFGWSINQDEPASVTIILDNETTINMAVRWRHTENRQVGFQCDHIDIDSISHLRRFVELNLGDNDLLDREFESLGK